MSGSGKARPANREVLPTGIEPVTFSSGGGSTVVLSADATALTASPADRCTAGCTETADRLDTLARAVALVASLPLPDAERAAVLDRVLGSLSAGGSTAYGNVTGRLPATDVLPLAPTPPGPGEPSEPPATAGTRVPSTSVPGTPATASYIDQSPLGGGVKRGATASAPRVPATRVCGES